MNLDIGDVKFLHLLLLMALGMNIRDFKSWKNQHLYTGKSLFGYARKVVVLVVIILANIADQILGLNGCSLMRRSYFIMQTRFVYFRK
ncbi:phage holin family protein [Oceanobacillus sp. FSL H7-0719]|uniref:phage holin family protein n=1 Tax=Oceanobacillus sp. FSL H7-0719 TaxID=2954507 RepID=UPI0038642EFC